MRKAERKPLEEYVCNLPSGGILDVNVFYKNIKRHGRNYFLKINDGSFTTAFFTALSSVFQRRFFSFPPFFRKKSFRFFRYVKNNAVHS